MKRRLAVMLVVFALASGAFPVGAAEPAGKAPAISGLTIERKQGGGFLGIEIVEGSFKLSFYGPDKKPVRADYSRALLRWDVIYKNTPERLILSAGPDGRYLTATRGIRPPYNFQLFITLISDDKAKQSESYVIRFRQ